ncbi:tetratricopeptide repeat protein [Bradyrhizobium murdochi]|uniref:tetratricopeptide repeat protein n=1 Tax=Bradyrhizobium murdochi TaxID=1038859 RepID=UPI0004858AF6|nr:tetratricopeptide repeat protein [Bradyrhizobium murdochi]
MNSLTTTFAARLYAFHPPSGLTLLALFATLALGGCASLDHQAISVQETPRPELLGAKDIDPAMRERIAHALLRVSGEESLREALKQKPDNVDAAISLTQALLAQRRAGEALEVADKILLTVPGDLRAMNAKGVVLDAEGRHDEAQALYREALAAAPGNQMLRNNLGLSLALARNANTGHASLQPLSHEPHALAGSP